jgi:hypothetical protein
VALAGKQQCRGGAGRAGADDRDAHPSAPREILW